jgi:hypothetical protein
MLYKIKEFSKEISTKIEHDFDSNLIYSKSRVFIAKKKKYPLRIMYNAGNL